MAQMRLDQPVTLIKDDRYVVRSYSPVRTIGGGQVLNPVPAKHKQNRPEVLSFLDQIASAPLEEIVLQHIQAAGFSGAALKNLLLLANIHEKQIEKMLQAMMSRRLVVQLDKEKRLYVHADVLSDLQGRIRDLLAQYHKANPLKPGMPKEELKSKLPRVVDTKLFMLTLQQMVRAGDLVQGEDMVHLAQHQVALGIDHQALRDQILQVYQNSGLTPPYFKAFCQQADTPPASALPVLSLLIDEGLMIKVKEDLYYHHEPLERLRQDMVDFFDRHEELTTLQFKDMTGASRKFMIPLLEYFDAIQFTIRVGDTRKLRKKATKT
jgi:selenocysteine-specific elongation factor